MSDRDARAALLASDLRPARLTAPLKTCPKMSVYGNEGGPAMSTVVEFKCPARRSPTIENGKVTPPRRVTNLKRPSCEHLTLAEVEWLIAAATKIGRHGLRVGELVALRREQVDLQCGTLHVNRKKNGEAASHPLSGRDLRAVRQPKRAYPESPFLFVTERDGPSTEATLRKIVAWSGEKSWHRISGTCCGTRPASTWQTTA